MPYIRAILAESDSVTQSLVALHKTMVRKQLASGWGYAVENIAFVAELLTADEISLSENLFQLDLIIDTGKKPSEYTDRDAETLKGMILRTCPGMEKIHFSIWIRGMQSNGFSSHKP